MIIDIVWTGGNENIYECDAVAFLDTKEQVKVVVGNSTGPGVRWLDKDVGTQVFVKTDVGGLVVRRRI